MYLGDEGDQMGLWTVECEVGGVYVKDDATVTAVNLITRLYQTEGR